MAGEAAKFGRSGVELLGVVSTGRLECSKPAAKPVELIWRQLDNGLGDFFDFHEAHYSTAAGFFVSRNLAAAEIRTGRNRPLAESNLKEKGANWGLGPK
jgi:hypothetical protein